MAQLLLQHGHGATRAPCSSSGSVHPDSACLVARAIRRRATRSSRRSSCRPRSASPPCSSACRWSGRGHPGRRGAAAGRRAVGTHSACAAGVPGDPCSPPERRFRLAAGLGLGLLLVVVVAAAGIRLEIGPGVLRPIHRAAASLEVIVVLWLGWMAWRARATRPVVWRGSFVAIGLTAFLSVLGIAAGQNPAARRGRGQPARRPRARRGLCLASWQDRRARVRRASPIGSFVGVLLAISSCLARGSRSSSASRLRSRSTACLRWCSPRCSRGWGSRVPGRAGKALFALALAAPGAGFTSLHYEYSAVAALVHALAAALLLASTAYALGRGA